MTPITSKRLADVSAVFTALIVALYSQNAFAQSTANELRNWTSKDGKFSTEASFVSFSEGRVQRKKANGEGLIAPTILAAGGADLADSSFDYLDGYDLAKVASGAVPARDYVIGAMTLKENLLNIVLGDNRVEVQWGAKADGTEVFRSNFAAGKHDGKLDLRELKHE